MTLLDRYRGSLLGLAAGDALGTAVEFQARGSFAPVTDIVGGGPFRLRPGEWTDDTAMALCLAESLIHCVAIDPVDQMQRYIRWRDEGHLSATGRCFDIGNTVAAALRRFEQTNDPLAGPTDAHTAGNGSLMRNAPLALFTFGLPTEEACAAAAAASCTTHAAREAIEACEMLTLITHRALERAPKVEVLSAAAPLASDLSPRLAEVAAGAYAAKDARAIRGSGYVVESLEAALWAFHQSESFEEGALLAVNLGDDADTTGAVYGQLAGAWYGAAAIPERWRRVLARRDTIESYAERLFSLVRRRRFADP